MGNAGPKQTLIGMIVFGVACLGGAVLIYVTDQIPSSWVKESGTITSFRTDYGGTHGGTTYCAVVTYQAKGVSYSDNATTCGGNFPTVGAQAQVAYNPTKPAQGKVVSGLSDVFFIGLSGLIGLALLVFAPIAYKRAKSGPVAPAGSVFTSQWPHVPNPVEQVDQAIAAGQGQAAPPAAPPPPPPPATQPVAPPITPPAPSETPPPPTGPNPPA